MILDSGYGYPRCTSSVEQCIDAVCGATSGTPIPEVEYTPEEISAWGIALSQLQELHPLHACSGYNSIVELFKFKTTEIPQLEDMSEILRKATGWQVGGGCFLGVGKLKL